MADWYVDFTLPTNGAGTTYSGAWNVFTGTEGASVSAGDSIWFRRNDPGNGAKLITIKSGDIKYIGWPKSGDVLYDTRPTDARSTWDLDLTVYVYQRKSDGNSYVHSLGSDNTFYRWYFYNYYTSYSRQRTIEISSKSNVSLYYCYLGIYMTSPSYNYSVPLRVENSLNVFLYKCTVITVNNDLYFKIFRLNNSSVKFDTCDFYTPSYTYSTDCLHDEDKMTSTILGCALVEFDYCTFHNRYNCSDTGYTTCLERLVHISSSRVEFNHSIIKHENTASFTNDVLKREPFTWFYITGISNIDLNGCEYNSVSKQVSLMAINSSSVAVTCSGLDLNISNSRNIVFSVYSVGSLDINGVTGVVNQYDGVDNANYLMAHRNRSHMFDNVTLSGINCYPGDVLERYNTGGTDIDIADKDMYKEFKVYFGSFINFTCDNCKFGGISFYHRGYSTSYSWYGCSYTHRVIDIKNTEIKGNKCLCLYSTYYPEYMDITVYNCIGDGSYPILYDTSTPKKSDIKLIRNKGFTGHGASYRQNTTYSCLFNNRDLKAYKYNYYGSVETNSVTRVGGAGYSVKLVHSPVAAGDLIYSPIGNETVWFRLPEAGTYDITAYLLYICDVCTLTSSDVFFEFDYFDSLGDSYPIGVPSLSVDTSTWSIAGNKIKLVSSVTVTDAQYCPIRFVLSTYYVGLIMYLDPKVGVELQ